MLCERCKIAVDLLRSVDDAIIATLHSTLHSFYDSIRIGCMACRQLWFVIAHGEFPGGFVRLHTSADIPQSPSLFELHFSDLLKKKSSFNKTLKESYPSIWSSNLFVQKVTNVAFQKPDVGSCVVFIQQGPDDSMSWWYNNDDFVEDYRKSCSFIFHPLGGPLDSQPQPVNFDVQGTTTAAMPHLWRGWLSECVHQHSLCRSLYKRSNFVPRRLVEIQKGSTSSQFKWRVIETAGQNPVAYLTLSHCWGTAKHLKLTTETYDTLQIVSDCSILPKTYRDAVQVTLDLGYRYLWIDSFCIIQDDARDWKEQSVLMFSVYSNADCNIAAMVSEDGTVGCFGTRDPSVLSCTDVSLTNEQATVKRYAMSTDIRTKSISWAAPLTRRAWVMQERYLARRQLCFLGDQVYWECNELVACEQQPRGLLRSDHWVASGRNGHWVPPQEYRELLPREPLRKPTLSFNCPEKVRTEWYRFVARYSACGLTYASDKAIAIAGVAACIQMQTQDEYLAGLWKRDLPNQVCWKVTDGAPWIDRYRDSEFASPTWSWISISTAVHMTENYKDILVCEFLDVTIYSDDPKKLYNFSGSTLTLRALGAWVRVPPMAIRDGYGIWPQQCTAEVQVDDDGNVPFSLSNNNVLTVWWDEDTATDEESMDRLKKIQTSEILIMFVTVSYNEHPCVGPAKQKVMDRFAREFPVGSLPLINDTCADREGAGTYYSMEGLLLWRSAGHDGKGPFRRVGVASIDEARSSNGTLMSIVEERLGLASGATWTGNFDIADNRLCDLIYTATII
ncbi:heterokaryon incompatibility protein-domain-containing protein [Xylaria sp. FL1042]|nr:heterokaryon incompatibility protein-domain-containing protein [Xylaria sp. FL1042]